MCKIITVANQKGGVGKTTVCQHLSYILAENGWRVLCVDFDPQANLTASLMQDGTPVPPFNVSGLIGFLLEDRELPHPEQYVTSCGKVDLIVGSKDLSRQESGLLADMGTERFLHQVLSPLRTSYDYIFIDTNRAASPLMVNALTAADTVLIPLCPEFYSTEGLSDLITTVLKNKRRLNPDIGFEGIVFSRCNPRTNLYRTIRMDVENAFADEIRVFHTAIPDTVKVGDAISRGLTVMEYAPDSKASEAYRALAEELIENDRTVTSTEEGPLHVLAGRRSRRVG